jgi:hypothetical protein
MSLSSLLTGRRYREAIAQPMGDNVSGVTTPKRRAPAKAARSMSATIRSPRSRAIRLADGCYPVARPDFTKTAAL